MNDRARHASALAFLLPLLFAGSTLAQNPPTTPAPAGSTAPAEGTTTPPATTAEPNPPAASAPTKTSDVPSAADGTSSPAVTLEEDTEGDDSAPEPAPDPEHASKLLQNLREERARAGQNPDRPVETAPADDGLLGTHQNHALLTAGMRFAAVPNAGFDPFSDTDLFTQTSLGLGRTLMHEGNWSLAALVLWDWGHVEDEARGADASLTVNRLTVGAEGRYHLLRRLYLFGRLAPGALHFDAEVRDRAAAIERTAEHWVFAADASGGAAFEFAGEPRGKSARPRGWLSIDGGYGWSASGDLALGAEQQDDGPERLEPVGFGELGLRGAFFRVAAAVTY